MNKTLVETGKRGKLNSAEGYLIIIRNHCAFLSAIIVLCYDLCTSLSLRKQIAKIFTDEMM